VPEPTAWALVELGKLELGSGHVRRAETALREALQVLPGFVEARAPLARVLAAQGDLAGATREARRASEAIPLPATVSLLADLLERQGRVAQARRQHRIATASLRLLAANGVRSDLDDVLLRADRGLAPRRTVALARVARTARPSIVGDDALGWALARAGRCVEAERWLDRALRLGTRDALLYFHRGYAAGCAGDAATMRRYARAALALDQHFSIRWGTAARRMAR
jgi:tetratricopeptide (TPR) repeat protein